MSSRFLRVLLLIAVGGVVTLAFVVVSATPPAAANARASTDRALLFHCVRLVLGGGHGSATPVPGSADPQVVSQFAVLSRTRSHADALPTLKHLRPALARADVSTYDPSRAVLLKRNGPHAAVYAVPATTSVRTLPAECKALPQLAGAEAYLGLHAEQTGNGPGVCLVSTQVEQSAPSGPPLPGARSPRPARTPIVLTGCESEAVLSGYIGALGDPLLSVRTRIALIPDGINAITYARADGHQFIVPVTANLATVPALSFHPPDRASSAELVQMLSAALPTTVTESGTGPSPTVTLTRPASFVAETIASLAFLRRLLTVEGVSTASSATDMSVSCSARTHRCVAVTLTATCARERCRMSRTIDRYRYVGAKPPSGTTGPNTLPTTPIRARVNRLVLRPAKLTLVLSGTPHRQVIVLLSVSCFSRTSATSGGGPPLRLAVPSRTPIRLPGRARDFHACNVSALVTSTQRSSVRVAVARR